jgi:hypothetical protein
LVQVALAVLPKPVLRQAAKAVILVLLVQLVEQHYLLA